MVHIGLIGGSGLEDLFPVAGTTLETRYGIVSSIYIGRMGERDIAFVPRHGPQHDIPPHGVNYRAIIAGLKKLGVERVIATNAVGAINEAYSPGDIVVPADVVDFTSTRTRTFYDSRPVTHVDMTEPYCREVRDCLIMSARSLCSKIWEQPTMACTDGPRFETPAEIRILRQLGCDIVGMTSAPEVFLAREAGLCYASLSFITNMAAGMQNRVSHEEVLELATKLRPTIRAIITSAVEKIGLIKNCNCRSLGKIEV